MIEMKAGEGNPHGDLHLWNWVLSVIQRYGVDSMSSEESEPDYLVKGQTAFRVKIVVWRRRIDDLLQTIDGARHDDPTLFSMRGSRGGLRIRPDYKNPKKDWPKSKRDPVKFLPYYFYDEEWFKEIDPEICQATLHTTAEEFDWFTHFATQNSTRV